MVQIKSIETWYKEHYKRVKECTGCDLHKTCLQNVPGHGKLGSDIMIVGEAPGAEEDLHGKPFVGRSGKLLDEMLKSAGLNRAEVYVTNVNKCRPPDNRTPSSIESYRCTSHLRDEILILNPKIIVTLGYSASYCVFIRHFFGSRLFESVADSRKTAWVAVGNTLLNNVILFPTYHPSYALRNPEAKILITDDFIQINSFINSGYLYSAIERQIVWQNAMYRER